MQRLNNKKIPKNDSFENFFKTYDILFQHHFMTLHDAIDKIEEILEYEPYIDLEEEKDIERKKTLYSHAEELIEGTYNFIVSIGFNSFFIDNPKEEHDLIGKSVLLLQNTLWLKGERERLYNVLVNDIPKIDKDYLIFFCEDNVNIYKYEIANYAKENKLERSQLLYRKLLELNQQSNEIIPSDLNTKSEFIKLWYWDFEAE